MIFHIYYHLSVCPTQLLFTAHLNVCPTYSSVCPILIVFD